MVHRARSASERARRTILRATNTRNSRASPLARHPQLSETYTCRAIAGKSVLWARYRDKSPVVLKRTPSKTLTAFTPHPIWFTCAAGKPQKPFRAKTSVPGAARAPAHTSTSPCLLHIVRNAAMQPPVSALSFKPIALTNKGSRPRASATDLRNARSSRSSRASNKMPSCGPPVK